MRMYSRCMVVQEGGGAAIFISLPALPPPFFFPFFFCKILSYRRVLPAPSVIPPLAN